MLLTKLILPSKRRNKKGHSEILQLSLLDNIFLQPKKKKLRKLKRNPKSTFPPSFSASSTSTTKDYIYIKTGGIIIKLFI
jgi:hypothetical protein